MSDNQETGTLADAEAMSRLMGDFASARNASSSPFAIARPLMVAFKSPIQ